MRRDTRAALTDREKPAENSLSAVRSYTASFGRLDGGGCSRSETRLRRPILIIREKYRENHKAACKMLLLRPKNPAIHAGFLNSSLSKLTGNDIGKTEKTEGNNRENF